MSSELHVIFGAGGIGLAIMMELAARGKRTRVVSRSGKVSFLSEGVEVVKGDAGQPDSTREVCKGAAIVYNSTSVPYSDWPTKLPPLQAGIIEGAAAAGAKLIFADNVYMYGEVTGPMTEDLPYAAKTRKGSIRARIAEELMEAHKTGKVRAAIGRASDYYGPRGLNSVMGGTVFYPALGGSKVTMIGDLDMPHTYSFMSDFAKGLVTLGEREEALGEVWHIPSAETMTTRQFITLVFEVAGTDAQMDVLPAEMVRTIGEQDPIMREMVEMLYEFEKPFILDHSKYERAFGSDVTPHREAIRQTLDWYRKNPRDS